MYFSGDVYSNNQSYEAPNNFEQQQNHLYDQQQQYENQQQQYEVQLQQHELQQPDMQPDVTQPQQEQIHEGDSMSYDSPAHYDQPVTPLNLRGGRITRARLRSESYP